MEKIRILSNPRECDIGDYVHEFELVRTLGKQVVELSLQCFNTEIPTVYIIMNSIIPVTIGTTIHKIKEVVECLPFIRTFVYSPWRLGKGEKVPLWKRIK